MVDHPPRNQRSFRYLVPLLLLSCGVILIFCGANRVVAEAWLDRAGPWAPIAFVLAGIASMSVLVPKTAVSVTAGALFGTLLGSLLMLVIAVVAAALNYLIGRWWLYDSLRQRLTHANDLKSTIWVQAAAGVASDAGFRLHLLIRLAPVPTTLISYAMGASGGRMLPFLMAAAVAVIPQMLWVHGGTAAMLVGNSDASGLRWASIAVSVLAALAVAVILPSAAMKRVEAMNQFQLERSD